MELEDRVCVDDDVGVMLGLAVGDIEGVLSWEVVDVCVWLEVASCVAVCVGDDDSVCDCVGEAS